MKGYTHIYTGDGKGKTTAAFGLAVRAAMSGKRVYIIQFEKTQKYHETKISEVIDTIHIEQWYEATLIEGALDGLWQKIKGHRDDMVILDEVTIALLTKNLRLERLIDFIKRKPETVELVLTGVNCPKELYPLADVITEMKSVKHYFEKGVSSREGIDC